MPSQPSARIKTFKPLPVSTANPKFSIGFFSQLTDTTNLAICGIEDSQGIRGGDKRPCGFRQVDNPYQPAGLKTPEMFYKTAAVMKQVPSRGGDRTTSPLDMSWAGDFVTVLYREEVEGHFGRPETIHEVKVKVKDKSMFSLIKKKHVDRDVRYDAQAGQFVMQIQRNPFTSCIPLIAARLKAIDRLVDFVSSIGDRAGGVKCENVTLRKFVFTYGDIGGDKTASGTRWKATLKLVRDQEIRLYLDLDNPHTRIWDMLNRLINSPVGMKTLPHCLQATLPLYRVLDSIENTWAGLSENGKGSFEVVADGLDSLNVHFELPQLAAANKRAPRRLRLAVKVKARGGEPWWEVQRYGREGEQPDEFDELLQPIFASRTTLEGWHGLGNAAVVRATAGIEALMGRISDAVRTAATGAPAPAAPMNVGASQGAAIVLD